MTELKYSKRAVPTIPVGHPEYVWRSHADVQETWRRFGWVPPSGQNARPMLREVQQPLWGAEHVVLRACNAR